MRHELSRRILVLNRFPRYSVFMQKVMLDYKDYRQQG
jgi:hypothetical protein